MSLSFWIPRLRARFGLKVSQPRKAPRRRLATRLTLEALEDRVVPSTASLLNDVGVALQSPNPQYMTAVGSTLYFSAYDGVGNQLGKYDGTNFTEIKVGNYVSSNLQNLTVVGDALYFSASDNNGSQLWKYDDTGLSKVAVGTYYYPNVQNLMKAGDTLYFSANDGTGYNQLWKYDGTNSPSKVTLGTYANPNPQNLTVVGDTLYFSAYDGTGYQLWKYDGTNVPSQITAGSHPYSGLQNLTVAGDNTLYFTAYDGIGNQLWKYDGTNSPSKVAVGTYASPNVQNLTVVGHTLYFSIYDSTTGYQLWKYDGTNSPSQIAVGTYANPNVQNLTVMGNALYFSANDGTSYQLWKYDGTNSPSKVTVGTYYYPYVQNLMTAGDTLYFNAYDSTGYYQLWQYNGTNPPSQITTGSHPYSNLQNLGVVGDTLYFNANDSAGSQLWRYDPTSGANRVPLYTAFASSSPSSFIQVGEKVFFSATNGLNGWELWSTDGTAAGTPPLSDINPGGASSSPQNLTVMGNALYFIANDGTSYQLWKYGDTGLSKVTIGTYYYPYVQDLMKVDGALYFNAYDSTGYYQLWKYDGINPPRQITTGSHSYSTPQNLTMVGDTLCFIAYDGSSGYQLWKYDGTNPPSKVPVGTYANPSPQNLTVAGDSLYFTAYDGATGYQLWKYDGTNPPSQITVGTYPNPSPQNLRVVSGTLYFVAYDGAGYQLWKYDGTNSPSKVTVGTYANPNPQNLTVVGDTLYFSAYDSTGYYQLWKYDDYTGLSQITTGSHPYSNPQNLTVVGDTLYFGAYASDGTGYQLWKYDGTNSPREVVINPNGASNPSSLYAVGDTLYLSANDGIHGFEPWIVTPQTSATQLTVTDADGPYTGNAYTASGTAVASDGTTPIDGTWSYVYYSGSSASGNPLPGAPSDAGTYTVVGTFTSKYDNYANGTAQTTFTISPTTPQIVFGGSGYDSTTGAYSFTYTAAPRDASATVRGVNNTTLGGAILTYYAGTDTSNGGGSSTAPTDAGTYTVVASYAGSTNYTIASASATITIGQASPQITFGGSGYDSGSNSYSFTYNGLAQGASVTVTGVGNANLGTPTLTYYVGTDTSSGGLSTPPTDVGTYTVVASFTGNDDYASTTASATLTITKADAVISVPDANVPYDGNAHSLSGSAAGVKGEDLSNLLDLGESETDAGTHTVNWSFAGNDNYNSASGTAILNIGQATPTVNVTDNGGPYTGNAYAATGSAVGLDGTTPVNGSLTYAYYVGTSASGTSSASAPTSAGTYTVVATFTSSDDNYASGGTAQTTFTIDKATATVNLSDLEQTYTGAALAPTYTTTPGGLTVDLSYSQNGNLVSSPTNAGTYEVTATINDPNYQGSASGTFTIDQATAAVNLNNLEQTYTGAALAPTYTTAPGGLTVDLSYSQNGNPVDPSNVVNAGTYEVTATINDPNYQGQATGTFTIDKATPTVTVSVTDASGTYNGQPFPASGSAVGIDGTTLVNGSFTYAYYAGSSASGTASATAPANAGTYTVVGTFASSDDNYSNGTAQTTFTIGKTTPTLSVTDAGGAYNGRPFPATGSAVGLDGTSPVSGTWSYSYYAGSSASGTSSPTAPSNAGTYTVVATFTSADGNYRNTDSPPLTFTIDKAVLTLTVNNASRSYGVANPSFTVSYNGFVNGQTLANSGVKGSPAFTTTATAASPPAPYAITATAGSLTAANYSFLFVNGTLTVNPAPLSASSVFVVSAAAGAPFSGAVATFTNADPSGNAASYTAVINWGDGSSSAGVISGSGRTFTVSGSHTYAAVGIETIQVTIGHKLGYTTTATVHDSAVVYSLGMPPLPKQTADIDFWQGRQGQALIGLFNGVSTSTALSTWLATTFPNLYGTGAGTNNLTGKSNTQVAAFFLNQTAQRGSQIAAEVLATALNVYATTLSLGGTAAQAYGFRVSAAGLGASLVNVGANGSAFDVSNRTLLNVYQLLLAANQQAVNGVLYNGNALLQQQANALFSALNQGKGVFLLLGF